MSDERFAGVDLGGTNVRVGITSRDDQLLAFTATSLDAALGAAAGLNRIGDLIEAARREAGDLALSGIGLGISGPLDIATGRIANRHSLTGWEALDVRGLLEQRFALPITFENDTDAAAIGEWRAGAGRGADVLAMVTLGTGVGVAVLSGGQPRRGAGWSHAEAGHLVVDPSGPACYCGASGCWEAFAAGTALALAARRSGDPALAGADAPAVVRLARAGNAAAAAILDAATRALTLGLGNVIAAFAPDAIVLGGGASSAYVDRLDGIRAALRRRLSYLPPGSVRISAAELGDRAGVIGAAASARQAAQGVPHPDSEGPAGGGPAAGDKGKERSDVR